MEAMLNQLQLPVDILDQIPGGYHCCIADEANGYPFVYISPRFLEIVGWTREEIRTRFDGKFTEMVHPDDRAHGLKYHAITPGENDLGKEDKVYRLLGKNGYIWVTGSATESVIRGIPCIQGTISDITSFMREEERFKQALLESEKQARDYSGMLRSQLNIINTVAKVFHAIYYIDMADYSFIQLGSTVNEVHTVIGEKGNAPAAFESMCKYLVTPEYAEEMRAFTDLTTLPDRLKGRPWLITQFFGPNSGWVEGMFVPANHDGEDNCRHIIWAVRTINEQKTKELAYQQELEAAAEEARRANEAKTNFLFSMSHDIRTPMNAMLGFSQLMKKELTDPKLLDYQEKIEHSGSLLLSIINHVLDMARIESGKTELHETIVSVPSIPADILTVFGQEAQKKGIQMLYDIRITHEHIYCDLTKLKEIYINIVSNAIKYTPAGGTVSAVIEEIPCEEPGYSIYRTVIRDTGIGISEEFLPHIFDSFSRERNTTTGKVAGSGLGLSIVK
ncbi:MAG: PAS domain-containing sensor histidine kinase [Clostridia bacterium]|nr:PAS domain-containing sensor histidine kinase [Clostridia bacterium]